MEELNKIWQDQEDFNRNFLPAPEGDFNEQSRQTKEYALHLISEVDELLRASIWKFHRKNKLKPNREQIKNELTDILKYLISLYITWEISPAEVIQDYWRKSMVVRQRYSEEFVSNLEGRIVLCDIDGVLADYYTGFLGWVIFNYPNLESKCAEMIGSPVWLCARSMGVDEQVWQEIKHHFRTSKGKLLLPAYPGAKEFLEYCRSKQYKIVLLTSRPIDVYPNIYTETLEWLKMKEIPFDFIWWASDKAEKVLSEDIRPNIVMAIDDDDKYIQKYDDMGIKSYHIVGNFPRKTIHVHSIQANNIQEVLKI